MSKADEVRKLLHLPNAMVAARTGYPESYIRTVRQRTTPDGQPKESNGDRSWRAQPEVIAQGRMASLRWYVKNRHAYNARRRQLRQQRHQADASP